MDNLTKEFLQQNNACAESIVWVDTIPPTDKIQVVKNLSTENPLWALWLVIRLMTKTQCMQFAEYVINQVKDIYEEAYPNSDFWILSHEDLVGLIRSIPNNEDPVSIFVRIVDWFNYAKDTTNLDFTMKFTYELSEVAMKLKSEILQDIITYGLFLVEVK